MTPSEPIPREWRRMVTTMAEATKGCAIIRLNEHRPSCGSCIYHGAHGDCMRPGGWRADPKRGYRCLDFERRQETRDG